MSRIRIVLLTAVAAVALMSPAAIADETASSAPNHLRVDYDQSTVVRLDRAAKTVVVGNPLIADALLVNDKTIYVQGRMFGNTNIIVVDSAGSEVYNTNLTVGAPDLAQVTLYRGTQGQRNLACAPRCERTVTQGDAEMTQTYTNSDNKTDISRKSADLATEKH
ncbi:MAG: pilus assembly protein N-terminal domain-containing protein [Alphaproteobacteria bacterium]|nr:pilus assembly protein N-terminal domain-containing protein [Alphaproteobacteria bacterium]